MTTTPYERLRHSLMTDCRSWLITGAAGFIGSHLLETLLKLNQRVVGLDNFSTGCRRNLDEVQALVSRDQWKKFEFIEGDIRVPVTCSRASVGIDYVLHQAALGSVTRSIEDPLTTNQTNVTGFLNMMVAARDARVKSFTYAASSSTYGDHTALPKVENCIGRPLSPYAVSKYVNELYADAFARCYGFDSIGLRYFNVFGPRQDPEGPYAAVIPKWTASLLNGEPIKINGDGETSRDFCYIANAVQANLLAATIKNSEAKNQVFNVAVGERTSLNCLLALIEEALRDHGLQIEARVRFGNFRPGDVRHSLADITKARRLLGLTPSHRVADGLALAVRWYVENLGSSNSTAQGPQSR